MKTDYVLHGWKLSYFSAKLRAYLRYKDVSFDENTVNALDLKVRIPKRTGSVVMPVLECKNGEWLQDTRDIIQELEARHAKWPVYPDTPKQLVLALLLEAWADDFWLPAAMHYRWSFDENYSQFEAEASRNLVPLAPGLVGKKMVSKLASRLRGFCPVLGVLPQYKATIETWAVTMFGHLDRHFAEHAFLLGGRPTVADFALCGPLYGHLYRDPAPQRLLFEAHPNVARWVLQTHGHDQTYARPEPGELLADDAVASTLEPVVATLGSEFVPMVVSFSARVAEFAERTQAGSGAEVPRSLDAVDVELGGLAFSRKSVPFAVWKVQEVVNHIERLSLPDQEQVAEWLNKMWGHDLTGLDLGPSLERLGLATRLA